MAQAYEVVRIALNQWINQLEIDLMVDSLYFSGTASGHLSAPGGRLSRPGLPLYRGGHGRAVGLYSNRLFLGTASRMEFRKKLPKSDDWAASLEPSKSRRVRRCDTLLCYNNQTNDQKPLISAVW